MKPLLEVKHLKKTFDVSRAQLFSKPDKIHAINDISFQIYPGQTLGLVGESGCGKSTVGKALLQLHTPDSGDVVFDGRSLNQLNKQELRETRKSIQIIFQDPSDSLNARHTVATILEEPFIIHNIGTPTERKEWIKELIQKVGLGIDALEKYPHEFSGGQKQRIGIARAIALKPQLIVCDEPVSALDVSVQAQIINLLLQLQQEMNLALLFISHDLSVVKHICDNIAVMYLGKIVEIGQAETIYKSPSHPYTQALLNAIPVPDPTVEVPPLQLTGELPSPINLPTGCALHSRCPKAQDNCTQSVPELIIRTHASSDTVDLNETGDDNQKGAKLQHLVACYYADHA